VGDVVRLAKSKSWSKLAVGVARHVSEAEAWFHAHHERPLTLRRRVLVALVTICLMVALRIAIEPIIGSDVSFTVFFPVVVIATLVGGGTGGLVAIAVGALVALAFSNQGQTEASRDAVPRLLVWLISSSVGAAVSLRLRRALIDLKRRQVDLSQASEQLRIVAGELEHRGKNALTIVEALSRDAARNAKSVDDYRNTLSSRIKAVSSGYSALTRREPPPMLLGSLVDDTLKFFQYRIDIADGPMVWLTPNVSIALALVLHELATNAAKYGALSNENGRVSISWRIVDGKRLLFVWAERNGPALKRSSYRGFGSRMIQQAFQRVPGGAIASEVRPDGLICRLNLDYGPEGPSGPFEVDRHIAA
jgi:two-component sensor histidine kinase